MNFNFQDEIKIADGVNNPVFLIEEIFIYLFFEFLIPPNHMEDARIKATGARAVLIQPRTPRALSLSVFLSHSLYIHFSLFISLSLSFSRFPYLSKFLILGLVSLELLAHFLLCIPLSHTSVQTFPIFLHLIRLSMSSLSISFYSLSLSHFFL